jgi:Lon protease-like protein
MSTYELPLFPLNTVLFPGMFLPLHIFEERYKEMVTTCLTGRQPFGVVYIREGEAERGPLAEPHEIGCTARIVQVQRLEEGRLNIMAVGEDRFRIRALHREKPYLIGEVETYPFADRVGDPALERAAHALHDEVEAYLSLLSRLGKVEFDPDQIPDDARSLTFLAASVLQVPMDQKQSFLATDQTKQLARTLRREYRQETAVLRWLPEEDQGVFSLN